MNERNPEKIVSLENYFPADVLPTTRFISALPGIDKEYSGFVGQGTVFWNGSTTIDDKPLTIRVSHNQQDTTFQLESERILEIWEMEENYCDGVLFQRKRAILPGTILNQKNRLNVEKHIPGVDLNFCGERDNRISMCDRCPLQDAQLRKKQHQKGYFMFGRPSDLPIRRVSEINRNRTRIEGFEDVQEAIDSIIALRDAIKSATPLLSAQSAPLPSSQSLISDRYFPTS